jgi:phosphate acetyltransferase
VHPGAGDAYVPSQFHHREDLKMSGKHSKYRQLIAQCKQLPPSRCAVAHPCDESSLRGAIEAGRMGLIRPILVGPQARIAAIAAQAGIDLGGLELVDTPHSHASAEIAVRLAREGKAEMLMKGSLHTDELMAAIVHRETGLRTGRRISHCFIMDVPTIDRVVMITDAAINILPKLTDKVHIVQNAIDLAHALGLENPKVAILSAMETVNPQVPSTLDAAALCKMAERGQITGGALDGPLALDNAIDLGAARIKNIASPVAGQADILVVPDFEAGNMLAKSLSFMADADAAGIVLGARVPIVLTSRADSVQARLASCAVGVLVAEARREDLKKVVV